MKPPILRVSCVLAVMSCGASGASTAARAPDGSTAVAETGSPNDAAPGGGQDAPTPIVTPCPVGEGGSASVGTWENVTPPYVVSHPTYTGVLIPLVNPQNPSEVYVTTDSDGVFKSEDCGATWTKANTGANAANLDSGRIWSAVIDPIEPETLYALTGYGAAGLWKTTNGGMDWTQMFAPGTDIAAQAGGFVHVVRMDRNNHLHLLVNFHNNCSAPHTPVCFGETTDGGQNWTVIDYPANLANAWCEACSVDILQSKVWLNAEGVGGIFLTPDGGGTWSNVTPSGQANWYVALPVFQTPDGMFYVGSQVGILSGTSDGTTWSLLANSGSYMNPIIGDGATLYAASFNSSAQGLSLYSASYNAPTTWSTIPSPGLPPNPAVGPVAFASDTGHHLLYLTLQTSGLWRMATQ
jgi:photosystem II stability/assembly factor-like uncharacterized protein